MLDRLEAKGLVRRTRSPDDRRLVNLELTQAGKAAYPRLREISMRVLNRSLRDFTQDEAKTAAEPVAAHDEKRRGMMRASLLAGIAMVLLAACASTHRLRPEAAFVPANSLQMHQSLSGTPIDAAAWPKAQWWTAYGDHAAQ